MSKETENSETPKRGRPTKYKPEYCQEIIKYFTPRMETIVEEVASQGRAVAVTKQVKSPFPTIEGFCAKLLISKDTLHSWVKKHEDFTYAYNAAKQLQKMDLMQGGLSGEYNAGFAKFVAINCTDLKTEAQIIAENSKGEEKSIQVTFPSDLVKNL